MTDTPPRRAWVDLTPDDAIEQLAAEIAKLPQPAPARLRVFANKYVPLARYNAETGVAEDALFWKIDGDIHVHPDRWEKFVEVMRQMGGQVE